MPSGLKPDDRGFCRIRRLLGSCLDEPGRFSDPDWKVGSAWEKGQLEKSSAGMTTIKHLSSSCLMQDRKTNSTCNKLLKRLARKWGYLRCTLPIHFKTEWNPHKIITLPRETCTQTHTVIWWCACTCNITQSFSCPLTLKSSYKCCIWRPFLSPQPLACPVPFG